MTLSYSGIKFAEMIKNLECVLQRFWQNDLKLKSHKSQLCNKNLCRFLGPLFVCVEVLWPNQHYGVMSTVTSFPNHTLLGRLSAQFGFMCHKYTDSKYWFMEEPLAIKSKLFINFPFMLMDFQTMTAKIKSRGLYPTALPALPTDQDKGFSKCFFANVP